MSSSLAFATPFPLPPRLSSKPPSPFSLPSPHSARPFPTTHTHRRSRRHFSPTCATPRPPSPDQPQHASSNIPEPTTPQSALPENPPPPGSRFYLALGAALTVLAVALPPAIANASPSTPLTSHYTMLALVYGFALAHSGLASLRPAAVSLVGERAYRVLFALVSLPGAGVVISYFIAHRYDGLQLWRLQGVPGVHAAVWAATFLSFLLLYPATFNLAEVAAIKRPAFRIYDQGVMRITRHPQFWGQVIWCVAHGAWMGTTLTVTASLGLVAHHSFAVWHGDRRLRDRYGEEWDRYAARTSVLPFRALADGRQKLVFAEFRNVAYVGVIVFILGTYAAHPAMLRAIGSLSL